MPTEVSWEGSTCALSFQERLYSVVLAQRYGKGKREGGGEAPTDPRIDNKHAS